MAYEALRGFAKQRSVDAAEKREEYRAAGREAALKNDRLHLAGCLMYWAEGDKSVNQCTLSNTDVAVQRLFVKFLRIHFDVPDEAFRVSVNYREGNGLTEEAIECYWLEALSLPRSCLRGHTIKPANGQPATKPYGVCRVRVNSTAIVQHIYGAIEAYQQILATY